MTLSVEEKKNYKKLVDIIYPGVYTHYSYEDVNEDVVNIVVKIIDDSYDCSRQISVVKIFVDGVKGLVDALALGHPGIRAIMLTYEAAKAVLDMAKIIFAERNQALTLCGNPIKLANRRHLDLAFLGMM